MMRGALLGLVLAFGANAWAQDIPEPSSDFVALRKEAMKDPVIKAALEDKTRSTESRLRDDGRMVELILRAAAAKPGQRVLDVGSGGGYLALLFSTIVGKKGHVDIHNTPGWINQFPSMDPDFQKRFIKRENVGWITTSWTDLDAPAGSYDLIVMGQVYHDVFLEGESGESLIGRCFAMLKPGGRLVIEDHDAIAEMYLAQQANLHRISHGDVEGQVLRAGFAMKEMLLMDSTFDDRRFNVFRPGVRGRTDRFIAVFEKPLDGKPLR